MNIDRGTFWNFLLLQERIEYSCATLLCELHDLGGGQVSLVSKYILDVLGIGWDLHSVKKRYIDIQLLYYLDELAELFVGHWLPYLLRKW